MHIRQGIANLSKVLEAFGVQDVVVCPGSRNAPIIESLSLGDFEMHSITDERSAGFLGVGMALQTRKPVALVCTSGSALLNFAPAVAEAYNAFVPLIVLSADRPAERLGAFENQTILQENILANITSQSINLSGETQNESELKAFEESLKGCFMASKKRPVHINIQIDEPVYEQIPKPLPISIELHEELEKDDDHEDRFLEYIRKSNRCLLVCGPGNYDRTEIELLQGIHESGKAFVIEDPLANLGIEGIEHYTEGFAQLISNNNLLPDLLIIYNGKLLSKTLHEFAFIEAKNTWVATSYEIQHDPLVKNVHCIQKKHCLENITDLKKQNTSAYNKQCEQGMTKVSSVFLQCVAEFPYADINMTSAILGNIPDDSIVHFANSSIVRYSQMVSKKLGHQYFSNRGVSGIDGSVSTAVGFAIKSEKFNVLISGDLSFIYDSNGLWNEKFPDNLKIIILNNKRGEIFNMLKRNPKSLTLNRFFVTPHNVNLSMLSDAFGIKAIEKTAKSITKSDIKEFLLNSNQHSVLAINTSKEKNVEAVKYFYNQIKTIQP